MRIEIDGARRMGCGAAVEQQQFDPARLPRINAEVDAFGENRGTQREASTRLVGADFGSVGASPVIIDQL